METDADEWRFQWITDPHDGKKLFQIEHEVRSMKHRLFNRPLVNRNHGITNMTYHPASTRSGATTEQAGGRRLWNEYDRPHADLREAIERVERVGELLRIKGADWNLEMGTLAEIVYRAGADPPAILFEDIPGYPKGFRATLGRDQLAQAARHHARLPDAVASARRGARLSRPHEDAQADPAARRSRTGRCCKTSIATRHRRAQVPGAARCTSTTAAATSAPTTW